MNSRLSDRFFSIAALIALITIPVLSIAAEEAATFESFYREPSSIAWTFAAVAALLVGILVFVGVFPATGPVAVIGTSLGGLMGLSGAAATNAGLALLGGGAIVSGGLGVMGGAAVLTAALSFGTDVILDYAAGNVLEQYEYRKFAENSWKMMTLPLPRNFTGPETVQAASKILRNSRWEAAWACLKARRATDVNYYVECMSSSNAKGEKELIRDAILTLDKYKNSPESSAANEARKQSLVAILYFQNNDYVAAKKAADAAYGAALKASLRATVPAFTSAASMLYDERPDFARSFELFQYAIVGEPGNQLTPVLFSAYLDRLTYRLNDRAANLDDLARLTNFSKGLADDDRKLAIQQSLMSYHFMQLKVAQQRILSLTRTENRKIREDPKSLQTAKLSLNDYDRLLDITKELLDRQVASMKLRSQESRPWWEVVTQGVNPWSRKDNLDKEQAWSESLWTYAKAWVEYKEGRGKLGQRVDELAKDRESIFDSIKRFFCPSCARDG